MLRLDRLFREENYSCDAANQLYQIIRSDNSETEITYDNNGSMTSLVTRAGGTVTENMAYAFDFDGKLVRVENCLSWPRLSKTHRLMVTIIHTTEIQAWFIVAIQPLFRPD